MITSNPYLTFNGNCKEALKFYETALDAKIIVMMNYNGSPMEAQMPPELRGNILHARFHLGENVVMASDGQAGCYEKPQGISMSLNVDTAEEAEKYFAALSEGAEIMMPIAETFWAERFGMLTDKFGIPWMVNCEKKRA